MGTHGFCGTCTWQENRRCHYFPPPVWQNALEMPRSQWPTVDPDTDWCSQHMAVAAAQPAQEEKPSAAQPAPELVPWRVESEPPAGIDPEEFVEPEPDPEDDKPHHHPHRRRKAHK